MTSQMDNAYLSESRQTQVYGACTSTYALAIIAVSLRLAARKWFSKAGIWFDDYTICASLAIATGVFVDQIIWIRRGLGKHVEATGSEGVRHLFLALFIYEILYTITLCLTKYSILLFYLRLFGGRNIRIPVMVLGGIVTAWAVAVIITTIFQCKPIHGFWDKSINPKCPVDVPSFFIGNAVPNIVTDWALLILPVPFVWLLHQSRAQRLALCGVFGLGGFICIISIVRLIVLIQLSRSTSQDVTWAFAEPANWTAVEINIGIVSACLPSLRPIMTAIFGPALFTGSTQRSTSIKNPSKRLHASYSHDTSHDLVWPGTYHEVYIRAGSKDGGAEEEEVEEGAMEMGVWKGRNGRREVKGGEGVSVRVEGEGGEGCGRGSGR